MFKSIYAVNAGMDAQYLMRVVKAVDKAIWDYDAPATWAEHTHLKLQGKKVEVTTNYLPIARKCVLAGTVCQVAGAPLYVSGQGYDTIASECCVPAWMVATASNAKDANLQLSFDEIDFFFDHEHLNCIDEDDDECPIKIHLEIPVRVPVEGRATETAASPPFALKRFVEKTSRGAKAVAQAEQGQNAGPSGPAAMAISERLKQIESAAASSGSGPRVAATTAGATATNKPSGLNFKHFLNSTQPPWGQRGNVGRKRRKRRSNHIMNMK
eukprot:4968091-Pyramimonas_sp.AAC.1